MKEENKKLIKVFLGKSASLKEGIFADNKKMPDFAPFIIDIMRDR